MNIYAYLDDSENEEDQRKKVADVKKSGVATAKKDAVSKKDTAKGTNDKKTKGVSIVSRI